MTFSYFIPVIIVIISHVIYHTTAKSIPQEANSFLALTVTYLSSMIISAVMYFAISKPSNILQDMHKLNWTSYVLGLAIVGVEIGFLYMYRFGWNISMGSLISSILLAILLIGIGVLFYKEHIGTYQIAGIGFCIVGLILINLR